MRTQTRERSWHSYVFGSPSSNVERDSTISSFEPRHPFVCFGEGDTPPAGGNEPPPAKTFSQDDVTRLTTREKAEGERAGRAKAEAEFKAKEAERDAREAELQKQLEDAKLAGKTEAEKQAHREAENAKKAAKAIEDERVANKKTIDDLTAGKSASDLKLRTYIERAALGAALTAEKALPGAHADALAVFHSSAKIDLSEDGSEVIGVTYGGVAHKTAADAAKAFLKERPHYQASQSPNGGSGARPGNGGGNTGGKQLHELSSEQLLEIDAANRAGK